MRSIIYALIFAIVIAVMVPQKTNSNKMYAYADKKDDDVVRLSLCADECRNERKNLLMSFGHAFLLAENISEESVYIYGCELIPGEKVTFSWWAVDVHMGIWFNIEPSYIRLAGRYENMRCVSMYIDRDDVKKLNEYMGENDTYSPTENCSKHVAACWNLLAEDTEIIKTGGIMTPEKIILEMENFMQLTQVDMPQTPNIFYYKDGMRHDFVMEL